MVSDSIKDYNRQLRSEINERIKNTYNPETGAFDVGESDKKLITDICYIHDIT